MWMSHPCAHWMHVFLCGGYNNYSSHSVQIEKSLSIWAMRGNGYILADVGSLLPFYGEQYE